MRLADRFCGSWMHEMHSIEGPFDLLCKKIVDWETRIVFFQFIYPLVDELRINHHGLCFLGLDHYKDFLDSM